MNVPHIPLKSPQEMNSYSNKWRDYVKIDEQKNEWEDLYINKLKSDNIHHSRRERNGEKKTSIPSKLGNVRYKISKQGNNSSKQGNKEICHKTDTQSDLHFETANDVDKENKGDVSFHCHVRMVGINKYSDSDDQSSSSQSDSSFIKGGSKECKCRGSLIKVDRNQHQNTYNIQNDKNTHNNQNTQNIQNIHPKKAIKNHQNGIQNEKKKKKKKKRTWRKIKPANQVEGETSSTSNEETILVLEKKKNKKNRRKIEYSIKTVSRKHNKEPKKQRDQKELNVKSNQQKQKKRKEMRKDGRRSSKKFNKKPREGEQDETNTQENTKEWRSLFYQSNMNTEMRPAAAGQTIYAPHPWNGTIYDQASLYMQCKTISGKIYNVKDDPWCVYKTNLQEFLRQTSPSPDIPIIRPNGSIMPKMDEKETINSITWDKVWDFFDKPMGFPVKIKVRNETVKVHYVASLSACVFPHVQYFEKAQEFNRDYLRVCLERIEKEHGVDHHLERGYFALLWNPLLTHKSVERDVQGRFLCFYTISSSGITLGACLPDQVNVDTWFGTETGEYALPLGLLQACSSYYSSNHHDLLHIQSNYSGLF